MPKAIAIIIIIVLAARTSPVWMLLSNISSTKFMSGTPGTMNKAQAKRGWRGVEVQLAGKYVVSQATTVETKAAQAIAI